MFFATSGPGFHARHPELQAFVLDPERKGLSSAYEFRVFWYGGGSLRQSGVTGVANLRSGSVNVIAEIVHPPFGYVLSLAGAMLDRRPELISDFARYGFDERVFINRRLPVLETHWAMTGDYRTVEQIAYDARVNDLRAAGIGNPEEVIAMIERTG